MQNRGVLYNFKTFFNRRVHAANQDAARTDVADAACDFSGVNPVYPGDSAFLHNLGQSFCISEIRRHIVIISDNQAAYGKVLALIVLIRYSIISD